MKYTMPEAAGNIWLRQSVPNQCVAFRREFTVGAICGTARLLIAADTDYLVWCNAVEAGRGQYTDFADHKTFTTIELPQLKEGKNLLTVLAYHAGADFFSIQETPAGMVAAVVDDSGVLLVSDGEWRATEHTGWRSGPMPRRTMQTCFTSEFDARKFSGDWMKPGFDDGNWPRAVCRDNWRCAGERPVPSCRLGGFRAGTPVKYGSFRRKNGQQQESFAAQMRQCDYFFSTALPDSPGGDDGVFIICDLGAEEAGFIAFELEAPAGTVVDFAHGEHLDDGIVRMSIGERNFADRYLCKAGGNRHELLFHRVGARYLQFNIFPPGGEPVKLLRAGIRPWEYPLPPAPEFHCDDLKAAPLRTVSGRTLKLCMHEHFEDCPWREQALFAYDARNQALYGYYLWGNYDFVRASFTLLARSYPMRSDHLMMMCAPMRFDRTIPIFSFIWVSAAWENYLYSGDDSLFRQFAPMVEDMITHALSRRDGVTGLCHTGTSPEHWNFYECTPGLDNDGCGKEEFHAGYNLYLIEMLESYALLLGEGAGERWREQAASLRKAVNAVFWDDFRGAYASRMIGGELQQEFHDHIQFLAVLTGCVSGDRLERLIGTLRKGELQFAVLNALPYLVNAMMPISPESRRYTAGIVRNVYGAMLEKGTSTLWETQLGAVDFANAGSLCHAWSSLPVYYQSGFLLGVRPLAPGFARFEVRPYADDWTHCAEGSVPTPRGEIHVRWQKRSDGLHLQVSHPEGMQCIVAGYPECPVAAEEIRSY